MKISWVLLSCCLAKSLLGIDGLSLRPMPQTVGATPKSVPTAQYLDNARDAPKKINDWKASMVIPAAIAAVIFSTTTPAFADEYGVEKEAPTLFTGETVMVGKRVKMFRNLKSF